MAIRLRQGTFGEMKAAETKSQGNGEVRTRRRLVPKFPEIFDNLT